MGRQRLLDGRGESHAIDRKRTTGRQFMGIGRTHDERIRAPHLLVQQTDGIVFPIVGAQ